MVQPDKMAVRPRSMMSCDIFIISFLENGVIHIASGFNGKGFSFNNLQTIPVRLNYP